MVGLRILVELNNWGLTHWKEDSNFLYVILKWVLQNQADSGPIWKVLILQGRAAFLSSNHKPSGTASRFGYTSSHRHSKWRCQHNCQSAVMVRVPRYSATRFTYLSAYRLVDLYRILPLRRWSAWNLTGGKRDNCSERGGASDSNALLFAVDMENPYCPLSHLFPKASTFEA